MSAQLQPQATTPPITGAFLAKWQALASQNDAFGHPVQQLLGSPTDVQSAITVGAQTGAVQHFDNGLLASLGNSAVFVVYGAIYAHLQALGGIAFLGVPVSDELAGAGGGRLSRFGGGVIYWTQAVGAFSVHGAILANYQSMGETASLLGYPITDESGTPDGIGRFNHFQNGSIYWTPQTGAQEVHGDIRAKWAAQGWERGPLGYPTSNETANRDARNKGRYNRFQKGHMSWTPATNANAHLNGTSYLVRLESFFITTLRSAHRDTDYVTLQVDVDGATHGPTTVNMGDVATGNHTLDLSIPITVDNPDSKITITYSIINSGHQNQQELQTAITGAVGKLANSAGVPVSGTDPMTELGGDVTQATENNGGDTSFWEKVGFEVLTAGLSLLFANCDGPVAGRANPSNAVTFTGASLNDITSANQTVRRTDNFPAPQNSSPHGCGADSVYSVTWSITRQS